MQENQGDLIEAAFAAIPTELQGTATRFRLA
jgi:hypothetical protein